MAPLNRIFMDNFTTNVLGFMFMACHDFLVEHYLQVSKHLIRVSTSISQVISIVTPVVFFIVAIQTCVTHCSVKTEISSAPDKKG